MIGDFALSAAVTAAAVIAVMAVAFLIGIRTGKFSVIDVIWGPGFVVVAWVSLLVTSGHGSQLQRWLLVAMVTVWGLRLGGYLLRRNHGLPEDPRYVELLADAGPAAIVRKVQLPQGLVMWWVSLPVQVGMVIGQPLWPLLIAGVLLWMVGLGFESIGDAQLAGFKSDPANNGRVMDRGLWRYTRHPNYFGDACVWWGIWLTTAGHWLGWASITSPLVMTYLLVAKTGKALTERRLQSSKPGYADYVRRTSGFFPLPPRVSAPSPTRAEEGRR